MPRTHAHLHIQIENDNGSLACESLRGFDPTDPEERKYVHDCLDEYLDWIGKKLSECKSTKKLEFKPEYEDTEFRIYGEIDTH